MSFVYALYPARVSKLLGKTEVGVPVRVRLLVDDSAALLVGVLGHYGCRVLGSAASTTQARLTVEYIVTSGLLKDEQDPVTGDKACIALGGGRGR